jgi:hypothetical protein
LDWVKNYRSSKAVCEKPNDQNITKTSQRLICVLQICILSNNFRTAVHHGSLDYKGAIDSEYKKEAGSLNKRCPVPASNLYWTS